MTKVTTRRKPAKKNGIPKQFFMHKSQNTYTATLLYSAFLPYILHRLKTHSTSSTALDSDDQRINDRNKTKLLAFAMTCQFSLVCLCSRRPTDLSTAFTLMLTELLNCKTFIQALESSQSPEDITLISQSINTLYFKAIDFLHCPQNFKASRKAPTRAMNMIIKAVPQFMHEVRQTILRSITQFTPSEELDPLFPRLHN